MCWSLPSPQDGKIRPGKGDVGERAVQSLCAGPKREESQTQSPAGESQRARRIYRRESIEVKMCAKFHYDTTSHEAAFDRKPFFSSTFSFPYYEMPVSLGNPMMILH